MVTVAAFYRFAPMGDAAALAARLRTLCGAQAVRGSILIAAEGINGTIAGAAAAVGAVIDEVQALPGCAALDVKWSTVAAMPFARLKVRVKREIVTLGVPGLDAARDAAPRIAPAAWNALIDDPDTILIDTRNAYEVAVGSFAGAIDPGTRRFGEFPAWFAANRAALAGKRIAMFCTGGIRCEKSTAFLRQQGMADVCHLDGGILAYLAAVPAEESRWQGDCFVFDGRVSVVQDVAPGTLTLTGDNCIEQRINAAFAD